MNVDFDVGIIGGGPAGSATAAYLAKGGLRVLVLERDIFPRPHVGESLVPSSTRVFNELGLIEKMEQQRFPRKYGGVWTSSGNGHLFEHTFEGLGASHYADIRFDEREQAGVDRPYSYHVDRGKFDLMLLRHAEELGATVREGVRVVGVDRNETHVALRYLADKEEQTTRVRMIVDASGRKTVVGSQLRWKVKDRVFDQYAVHTWFEDFDRSVANQDPAKSEFIFIHFLPLTNSWIWQIPIDERITSVGVVTQKKHFRSGSREAFFWEAVGSRPEVAAALKNARQMRPFTEEADYSYAMDRFCDDRVVLVGDAARFVDPIFSTGVSIALSGARFASKDILEAAKTGRFDRAAFANYERTMKLGTKNWYDFICCYYRLNVLFTAFIRHPKYRLELLKLIQGDVYDEETPAIITKMQQIVAEVEGNEKHIWHKHLGDLTAQAFRPAWASSAEAAQ
jgi:1H-pyrrole-2-carbonyl-[peptidyl-carrier protein] chlorinase